MTTDTRLRAATRERVNTGRARLADRLLDQARRLDPDNRGHADDWRRTARALTLARDTDPDAGSLEIAGRVLLEAGDDLLNLHRCQPATLEPSMWAFERALGDI